MKKIEEILSNYRHTIEFLSIIVALKVILTAIYPYRFKIMARHVDC
jgi:hypothetical protein